MHFARTVIGSRNGHRFGFLLSGFFFAARMPLARTAKEYRAGRGVRPRERAQRVKSGVLARCVEIERFMPKLIDSPRYYELYDFYEKSVLTACTFFPSPFLSLRFLLPLI